MIVVIVAGFVALLGIALAVGILDHAQRPRRRQTAAERRLRWEQTRQLHGGGSDPAWDDD